MTLLLYCALLSTSVPLGSGYWDSGLTNLRSLSSSGDYCSLSSQHQLCRPLTSSPAECGPGGVFSTGLTQGMRETIVRSHNR